MYEYNNIRHTYCKQIKSMLNLELSALFACIIKIIKNILGHE
jgi:hypothetical protein